ncbi:MAG: hypothetical protein AAGK21_17790, partial [Bacteroidota bacterium]
MRLLALSLTGLSVLAACAAPTSEAPPPAPPQPPPPSPAGSLSAAQEAMLAGLGIPVLVPSAVAGFGLVDIEATTSEFDSFYALRYQRADGTCFEVSGAAGGFGGPEYPIVSTDVIVRDLGLSIRLYEASRDPDATSAQTWGPGTVVSETIGLDGAGAIFRSSDENRCRPLTLREATPILAGLRLLPAGGAFRPMSDLGAFAPADDVLDGYNAASSPESAAEAVARRYEGDAQGVTVDVLQESAAEAVVLVTALGLADDSVRDERLRLTYLNDG